MFDKKENWQNLLRGLWDVQVSKQKVYPPLGGPVTVTGPAAGWTLGNFSNDIIAAGAQAYPFTINWIVIGDISANDDYEIRLYAGDTDIEIGQVSFARYNAVTISWALPMHTDLIAAGSRVRAKLASSTGSDSCSVKLFIQEYDDIQ